MTTTTDCQGTWRDDYRLVMSPPARNYIAAAMRCDGCGERKVWVVGLRGPIDLPRWYDRTDPADIVALVAGIAIDRHEAAAMA
jgi:hypothetical protein